MNHGYIDRPIGPDREEGTIDDCDNCKRYFPSCDLLITHNNILCERCYRFREEEE